MHLVGGAAGPLGGDRLRLEIEVGAGALLDVRSVAASLALPGAGGAQSRLEVTARVEVGRAAALVARAADRRRRAVTTCPARWWTWRTGAAWSGGRNWSAGGTASRSATYGSATTVRYAGRTLLPQRPGGRAARAGLVGAGRDSAVPGSPVRCCGSTRRGPTRGLPEAAPLGAYAARLPLAGGPAVLVSATGADLAMVRHALHERPALAERH